MTAQNARVVALASGKGGVGKSTLSVGLGTAAAKAGKQVLLVEFDAGLRGIDIMLGLTDQIVYDLGDLMEGRCNISSAILECPFCPGFFAIVAPAQMTPMALQDVELLVSGLRPHFDLILLDMPAGLGFSVQASQAVADNLLVVVTPDPVCIRDGNTLVQGLTRAGFDRHRLIINRVSRKLLRKQIVQDLDEVIDGVGSQLIGVVPEDPEAQLAAAAGAPMNDKSEIMQVCAAIIRRISGDYVPLILC